VQPRGVTKASCWQGRPVTGESPGSHRGVTGESLGSRRGLDRRERETLVTVLVKELVDVLVDVRRKR